MLYFIHHQQQQYRQSVASYLATYFDETSYSAFYYVLYINQFLFERTLFLFLMSPRSDVCSWNKNTQKKNFWKNLNKSLYLFTRPLNTTYWKSKQLDYNQNNMDGDPGTADVETNDAESTQASVPQCTPTSCKYHNNKHKLECTKCKRLVHYGCTSVPTYQLQLFLTKGYRKFMCC